jgi:hypothetical protein
MKRPDVVHDLSQPTKSYFDNYVFHAVTNCRAGSSARDVARKLLKDPRRVYRIADAVLDALDRLTADGWLVARKGRQA